MHTDHDTSYKRLFAHAELLRELLAGFLPFAWARRLNIQNCTRHNASYASDTGHQRHDDMVWRVRTGAPVDDVYVLLEFQSQPDRWMASRMQVYAGLLHQELLKEGTLAPTGDLPAVLPLVVYSGSEPWNACRELADLAPRALRGLRGHQPTLRYRLIDQAAYAARAQGPPSNVVAALFRLARMSSVTEMPPLLDYISRWLEKQANPAMSETVEHWLRAHSQRELDGISITGTIREVRAMHNRKFATFEELYEYEAIQKGIKQGRQEGIQQGLQQGLQRIAYRLVQRGLGCIPGDIAARISLAPPDQLQDWCDRLVDGASPAEVFQAR
jgi:predicted transposase/invertase (TIGR01784 family)